MKVVLFEGRDNYKGNNEGRKCPRPITTPFEVILFYVISLIQGNRILNFGWYSGRNRSQICRG